MENEKDKAQLPEKEETKRYIKGIYKWPGESPSEGVTREEYEEYKKWVKKSILSGEYKIVD